MAKLFRVLEGITIGTLIFSIAAFMLAAISARTDTLIVQNKVADAIRTSDIQYPGRFDVNDKRGIDTWADCFVLDAAILRHGRLSEDMFDALVFHEPRAHETGHQAHPCDVLVARFAGHNVPNSIELYSYNRYWFGSATTARIALGMTALSIKQYKLLLLVLSFCSLLAFVLAFFWSYGRGAVVFLPFFMSVGAGYGLLAMGQGMTHAPEFIVGTFLLAAYSVVKVQQFSLRARAICYSILGGVCVYLDVMDSAMVLIEILLCCQFTAPHVSRLLSISRGRNGGQTSPHYTVLVREIVTNSAFVGVGGCIAIALRILGYSISSHTNVLAVASSWMSHLSHRIWGRPGYLGSQEGRPSLEKLFSALKDSRKIPFHGFLSRWLGDVFYLLGFAAWVIAIPLCWRLHSKGLPVVTAAVGFLIAAALVPAWFLVFEQQTIIHAWMTGRLVPLFCGLGMSLAVLAGYIARTEAG